MRPILFFGAVPASSPDLPAIGCAGPRTDRQRFIAAFLALATLAWAAGCSLVSSGGTMPKGPVSVQKVEYYPYQVKGYQNTYPNRTLVVLMPLDSRSDKDSGPQAPSGTVPIGEVTDRQNNVIQRLYSSPLPAIVQQAIFRSAGEAGFSASVAPESAYQPDRYRNAAYVLQSEIERCWVKKSRGPDGRSGPTWRTVASFALKLALYKPPFKVPFWQGTSASTYHDPPIGSLGLGPEDEVGIYDKPGQDLSVAVTRGVAGIFEHRGLHTLILQDIVLKR